MAHRKRPLRTIQVKILLTKEEKRLWDELAALEALERDGRGPGVSMMVRSMVRARLAARGLAA